MNNEQVNKLYAELKTMRDRSEDEKERREKLEEIASGGLIQKPKGFFKETCPKCEKKLLRQKTLVDHLSSGNLYYHLKTCSNPTCDYEWAWVSLI